MFETETGDFVKKRIVDLLRKRIGDLFEKQTGDFVKKRIRDLFRKQTADLFEKKKPLDFAS